VTASRIADSANTATVWFARARDPRIVDHDHGHRRCREIARRLVTSAPQLTWLTRTPAHNPVLSPALLLRIFLFLSIRRFGEEDR
jgi:hypothetical protein